jgi:hypothetical protein
MVLVLPDGTIIHTVPKLEDIEVPETKPVNTEKFKEDITEELLLYPNPVSDMLYLSKDKDYAVYSTMGRLLLKGSGPAINMNNLPDGIYFIFIENVSYKVLKRE